MLFNIIKFSDFEKHLKLLYFKRGNKDDRFFAMCCIIGLYYALIERKIIDENGNILETK